MAPAEQALAELEPLFDVLAAVRAGAGEAFWQSRDRVSVAVAVRKRPRALRVLREQLGRPDERVVVLAVFGGLRRPARKTSLQGIPSRHAFALCSAHSSQ